MGIKRFYGGAVPKGAASSSCARGGVSCPTSCCLIRRERREAKVLEWLREEIARLRGRLEALEEAGKVREELVALVELLQALAERVAGEIEIRRAEHEELARQVSELREQQAEEEEEEEALPEPPAAVPPVPPPAPVTPEPEKPQKGLLARLF